MKILIFIQFDISAFNISDVHLNIIKKEFPYAKIINVKTEKEFLEKLPDSEIVLCWKFKKEWYTIAKKLQYLSTPAAGKEFLDADPTGKIEGSYGAYHGKIMAEVLLGMIIYFNRNFKSMTDLQKKHIWSREAFDNSKRLGSQHITIIGYGAIGRYCAKILKPFGCTIDGIKRSPRNDLDFNADNILTIDNLNDSLKKADHVVLLLPQDNSTNNIIKKENFKAMKKSAILHNLGRGNCYSENDLLWALQNKEIAGAALDVFNPEPLSEDSLLWDMPNVLISPHASAICQDYLYLYLDYVIPEIKQFLNKDA